jgi:hypothetical protein
MSSQCFQVIQCIDVIESIAVIRLRHRVSFRTLKEKEPIKIPVYCQTATLNLQAPNVKNCDLHKHCYIWKHVINASISRELRNRHTEGNLLYIWSSFVDCIQHISQHICHTSGVTNYLNAILVLFQTLRRWGYFKMYKQQIPLSVKFDRWKHRWWFLLTFL